MVMEYSEYSEYSEYTIVVVKLNDVGKVHIHAPTSALKILPLGGS